MSIEIKNDTISRSPSPRVCSGLYVKEEIPSNLSPQQPGSSSAEPVFYIKQELPSRSPSPQPGPSGVCSFREVTPGSSHEPMFCVFDNTVENPEFSPLQSLSPALWNDDQISVIDENQDWADYLAELQAAREVFQEVGAEQMDVLVQENADLIERVDPADFSEEEDVLVPENADLLEQVDPQDLSEIEADSGYDSDQETIENIRDNVDADPDFIPIEIDSSDSDSDDSEAEYEPQRDMQREARLHRILGLKKNYWKAHMQILRIKKRRDLQRTREQLIALRNRRFRYNREVPAHQRQRERALYQRGEDLPRRNRDMCFGCGKNFYSQHIPRWLRCEDCGSWLCPDCNVLPDHCRGDGGLLN